MTFLWERSWKRKFPIKFSGGGVLGVRGFSSFFFEGREIHFWLFWGFSISIGKEFMKNNTADIRFIFFYFPQGGSIGFFAGRGFIFAPPDKAIESLDIDESYIALITSMTVSPVVSKALTNKIDSIDSYRR